MKKLCKITHSTPNFPKTTNYDNDSFTNHKPKGRFFYVVNQGILVI